MLLVKTTTVSELEEMSKKMYEPIVKAVVDIESREIVVDAEYHSDQELFLLDHGSNQENLWGINLWPDKYGTDKFIEFDSMINLRPRQNNRSRGVENSEIRNIIIEIVNEVVKL